ncbi:MAG: hypothetical protein HYX92_14825 [Chloroflexi bacterium]|nr:hypothetical protein [Chloroflexota bacterium]
MKLALILAILVLFASAMPALAWENVFPGLALWTPSGPPALPGEYAGAVSAPDGTAVVAKVGSYTSKPVFVSGGRYINLLVQPGGASLGQTITFWVGGVQAWETDKYTEGSIKTQFALAAQVP